MQVINRDANGNIIKDLSQVTLNEELSKEIVEIITEGRSEQCQKAEQANA